MIKDTLIFLIKDEKEKIKEMIKWAFEGEKIETNDMMMYHLITEDDLCKKYDYFYYLEALLVHIPRALGMKIIIVDPQDQDSLFKQVSERYDMFKSIPEKSEVKPLMSFVGNIEEGDWSEL